jgi:hypothetical protein
MTEPDRFRPTPSHNRRIGKEAESIGPLLREGITAIRTIEESEDRAGGTFVLMSLGIEKLLRLTVGIAEQHRTGTWPSALIGDLGRNIVALDDCVRQLARDTLLTSNSAIDVDTARLALGTIDANVVWPILRAGLSYYGASGGYHSHDWANEPTDNEDPADHWAVLHSAVYDLLFKALDDRTTDSDDDDEAVAAQFANIHVYTAITDSVIEWWIFVFAFWQSGLFGSAAQTMSGNISQHDGEYGDWPTEDSWDGGQLSIR